jgi:hypothetical protein
MKHNLPYNHPSDDTLLLITSDASRGANRYSGLAAILREVPYDTNQEKDSTNVTTWDRVTIATRRMHSQNARDISKLEVAAVAMGIRTAIKYIPPDRRRTVLILTDSSSALNFFCRNNDISLDNNHTSLTLLNDPHYKAMQMMLQENIDQERENVTSKILMAKVKSNKFENEGFFDHDATDIISSAIKNKSNRQASEIYSWGNDEHVDPSMMGDSFQKKIMDDLTNRRLLVPSLQSQDIDFLALSETKFELKVKKPQVVVKRERGERLERSKQRIKDELGINIF